MLLELGAIVSAIGTVNSAIETLKKGKANADDVARLIGKFGTQTQKLDEFERKQKLKRPARKFLTLRKRRRND